MKFSNKEKGNYLIWVTVNFVVLLALGNLSFGNGCFYPFCGLDYIESYDISEFLVYTIAPILTIFAIRFRNTK